jgi:hypothetical protein
MTMTYTYKDLVEVLKIAQEHILQYQQYSEAMRKIGRGFSPSSEFKEGAIRAILTHAIDSAEKTVHGTMAEEGQP